ncbi:hypothetical protein [Maribacter sp. Asnod1-A12]|uniref:hypothetical protein n=1 Tax=Maribacter sp. Asnod1-A12 TaxID=3160576 RepID=UPI003867E7D1
MLQALFLLISLLSLLLFYYGTGKNKRLVFTFSTWQIVIGALSITQVFKNKPILFIIPIIVTTTIIIWGYRKVDNRKIEKKYLLATHILRIPVELILYQLFLDGKIPKLMTFEGWNFDILIGISALIILAYQIIRKKKLNRHFYTIWNLVGILFLITIVIFAILSAPLPIQRLAFNQPNIAVLEFPFCFLPTCVVPLIFISHFIQLKSIATTMN